MSDGERISKVGFSILVKFPGNSMHVYINHLFWTTVDNGRFFAPPVVLVVKSAVCVDFV